MKDTDLAIILVTLETILKNQEPYSEEHYNLIKENLKVLRNRIDYLKVKMQQ